MAKRKNKKRQTKKSSLDFGVIITIIFSALLTVLIYTESGYIGIVLSDFFGGMFGIIKYVLPIILIAIWIFGLVGIFDASNPFEIIVDLIIALIVVSLSILFTKLNPPSHR